MLKGDLATTSVETVLIDLAEDRATGCLHVVDDAGVEALVYLKNGLIYAISVPGERPQLGARLISSNALVPEGLAEALEAQRTELQGWRLGELLVHLGFVEQSVVEAFVQEQVTDGFTDLMAWTSGRWRFRDNERTREDVAPPATVAELLEAVRGRQAEWAQIVGSVHGPNAVPMLSTRGGEADVTLDPDAWSLLCKIDGERSIAELARECGFTLFEAGNVVRALVKAGLVEVEEDLGPDDDQRAGPAIDRGTAVDGDLGFSDPLSRFDADFAPADDPPVFDDTPALLRVSEALSRAFAPGVEPFVDPFHVPDEIRLRPAAKAAPVADEPSEEDLRRARIRQAAAAELAAAHAEAEAMRKHVPERVAEVVDLEARREAARADAERLEAERAAREETERLAAERLAAEAAEEAERLEAERAAAEAAAEAERLEAERLEAERLAQEQAKREEAERLEAERAAQEQAEREEAERLEAERAAREETERLEAERLAAEAAEEAERLEAERAAADAAEREDAERLEAERAAQEQAEREEAERRAREEAERLEREKTERLEAERLEAEQAAAEAAARAAAERALTEAAQHAAEEAAATEAASLLDEDEPDDDDNGANGRPSAVHTLDSTDADVADLDVTPYTDADEATRLASASALLSELSRTGSTTLDRQATAEADDTAEEDDPNASADNDDDENSDDLPEPIVQRDLTDTASLLRELSSLGFDDDQSSRPSGAWPAPSSPRPVTTAPPKKKRGLFGR